MMTGFSKLMAVLALTLGAMDTASAQTAPVPSPVETAPVFTASDLIGRWSLDAPVSAQGEGLSVTFSDINLTLRDNQTGQVDYILDVSEMARVALRTRFRWTVKGDRLHFDPTRIDVEPLSGGMMAEIIAAQVRVGLDMADLTRNRILSVEGDSLTLYIEDYDLVFPYTRD